MADIFHEIDEDLRRERLGKIWTRFGGYIIGLAVLIVLGVGAWRGYEWWQAREAAASGARFAAALNLAEEGKHAEAQAAFAEIAKDGTGGYRILARFRAATELAYSDKAAAVAAYDALANENGVDPLARDVARIRAGLLLVDTASLPDIEARMKPLDTPTGAFRNSAREILGLAQYRAGDYAGATKSFESILADAELSPGMRQRAELMRTLAAAGSPPPAGAAQALPVPSAPALPVPTAPVLPPASEMPTLPGASPIPEGSWAPSTNPTPAAPSVPEIAVPAPTPVTPTPEATTPDGAPADEAPSAPAVPAVPGPDSSAPAEPAPPASAEPAPAPAPPQ
ncbi:MAG: hypothetical protein K0R27_1762 [Xanthobacteraceae bacterium]|jgi:hypothetical protein|nr:hypothetical protein [Xanthobacteraceae bacterium]